MLNLTNICKNFGDLRVLLNVSLAVENGKAVCLAGANATGKTTLLAIAVSRLKPESGFVFQEGRVGYVPQEPELLPDLTVIEHLQLWYAACGLSKAAIFSENSYERILGLELYRKKRAGKLSGGIQKRLSIACALAGDPVCLVLDEPFTALDAQGREEILTLFNSLKERGKGILFSSHDPVMIAGLADEICLLKNGRIVARETVDPDPDRRAIQVYQVLTRV